VKRKRTSKGSAMLTVSGRVLERFVEDPARTVTSLLGISVALFGDFIHVCPSSRSPLSSPGKFQLAWGWRSFSESPQRRRHFFGLRFDQMNLQNSLSHKRTPT
jgi:hypothetical protein